MTTASTCQTGSERPATKGALSAPWVDIKRFAVHDGPGIRTTLYFQGCPLRCPWCHNPEAYDARPCIAYRETLCFQCGECVAACPNASHALVDGRHVFDRASCTACGQCVRSCLGSALRLYGSRITVEEAVSHLLRDRMFYEVTGGGATLSGGEPLLHVEFCCSVLARLKKAGIHTAIDTCGYVSQHAFEHVLPHTDLFLYDLKAADGELHQRLIGKGNDRILGNLRFLAETGKPVEVRMILVPGHNMSDAAIKKAGEILCGIKTLAGIRLLPYHDLARSTFIALGLPDTMPHVSTPGAEALHHVADCLQTVLPTGIPVMHSGIDTPPDSVPTATRDGRGVQDRGVRE